VDDGKSTLIGRLLHDAHSVNDDQMEALRNSRVNRSSGPLDLSLLTDGLKAEREQGITIDVAYRHFATPQRRFLVADTPGHAQYTRNMATGASTADATVILVDARHGLTAQSRRHAYIAWLLGIRHVLVAVNKMDLAGYDSEVFERIRAEWHALADKLAGTCFHILPVSALEGDNVFSRSARMPWYDGPSLVELLERIDAPAWDTAGPVRLAVQYVIRPDLDFRGYAGRIDSGRIQVGDPVTVLPSGKQTRVKRIVTFEGDLEEAFAPMAVTLVLGEELDISRGDWICGDERRPSVAHQLEANVVWMHERQLQPGATILVQQGATRVSARVGEIAHRVDPETYDKQPASELGLNEIGLVRLETVRALVFDPYRENRQTGSFVLIDPMDNSTLAAGMVERAASAARGKRFERYGHGAALIVSPSEPLRNALQQALFAKGAVVASMDSLPSGEHVRQLLANGLILLGPADPESKPFADWIEATEQASMSESVQRVLTELADRGVL
jgi:sulfate adenylyltransferase large subunit